MAGEVRSELKITLAGGVGSVASPGVTGSAIAAGPVARHTDLDVGQFQAMREYARRARSSQNLAEVLSRDRDSVRVIEEAVLRRHALAELDVSSARRAREEAALKAANRREAFRNRVRFGGLADDSDFGGGDRVRGRALRSSATAAKRLMKGWGVGVASGLTSQLAIPDDGGAFGAVARIGLSTVSGAAWGGVPGAVGSFLTSAISEIVRESGRTNQRLEALGRQIASIKAELDRTLENSFNEMRAFNEKQAQEFDVKMQLLVDGETIERYREERFVSSGLVN